jgi:hypothetical protein
VPFFAFGRGGCRRRRDSSSAWRTDRSRATIDPRSWTWAAGASVPSARAWPSVMCPSDTATWTAGSMSSSRIVLATVALARPTRVAICSWVIRNSSASWR